jgi:cytochrome c551/c552
MSRSVWVKRVGIGAIVVLAVIQLYRPAKTNPPIDPKKEIGANMTVDPQAAAFLKRACYDCHSNHTVWPWYSNVAPVSWLVTSDVNDGRRRMNMSDWSSYPPDKRSKFLDGMCKRVTRGNMPLWFYKPMHPKSWVSKADAEDLCRWTTSARQSLASIRATPR